MTHITIDRKILEQVLGALESITWVNSFNEGDYLTCNFKNVETSITAVKEALARPEQEPVALPTAATKEANDAIEAMLLTYNWPCNTQNAGRAGWEAARKYLGNTTQPQRKPLTDEEIDAVTDSQWAKGVNKPIYAAHRAYARAIEAAHNIKE